MKRDKPLIGDFVSFSNSQIKYGAAYLTLGGNVVVYATIFAFFLIADSESSYGGGI